MHYKDRGEPDIRLLGGKEKKMREQRVEYNTIRDDFSVYKVENGQILKVKLSVVEMIDKIDEDSENKGALIADP